MVSIRTTRQDRHLQEIPILIHLESVSRPQPAILYECLPRGLLIIIVSHCDVSAAEVHLAHLVDISIRTVLSNDTRFLPRDEDTDTFDDARTLEQALAKGGKCLTEKVKSVSKAVE
jgi:hypothetical protein